MRANPRPANLDGPWEEKPTDKHGYRHFLSGPVEVVGFDGDDGFEPDGELVTAGPIDSVHIERMDNGVWWMAIYYGGPGSLSRVTVEFHSKKRIDVAWRAEP